MTTALHPLPSTAAPGYDLRRIPWEWFGFLALAAAVPAGLLAVMPSRLALLTALSVGLVVVTMAHPPAAVYLYLGVTPFVAGIDRGVALPLVRPNEAMLLLLTATVGLRLAWQRVATPGRGSWRGRLLPVDRCLLLLVFTGSVVPLLWLAARGHHVTQDDALYAADLWKYLLLYGLVRVTIRTPRQVGICLGVVVATSVLVGLIGALQAEGLFGVRNLLAGLYKPSDINVAAVGRGASTLGSSLAVGDVTAFSLTVVIAALVARLGNRRTLAAAAAALVVGALGSGQFSAAIGVMVGIAVVGFLAGSLRRLVALGAPTLLCGGLLVRGVVAQRVAGLGLHHLVPQSWAVRWDNLRTFFWPVLFSHFNYILGVRPAARIADSHYASGWVWIESGHTWLLWTGGLPFAAAFLAFVWVGLRATRRVSRARSDEVGVAGTAACASLAIVAVLMTFDPHLTLRGAADLLFPLLALAFVSGGDDHTTVLAAGSGSSVQVASPGTSVRARATRPSAPPGPSPHGGILGLVARALDVVLAATILGLTAPILLVIVLTLKLESGGPVLRRTPRPGRDSHVFRMLTFRSTSADGGITRLGHVLGAVKADALPELINVLAGDMSLVRSHPQVPRAFGEASSRSALSRH